MSATDLDPSPTPPGVERQLDTPSETPIQSALGYSPDEFVDDDSWAKPRPRGNRRLVGTAATMGVLLVGLGTFTLGAKLGKDSTKTSTGGSARNAFAAAFGGAGGFGGFGGAPGGGFGGRSGTGTGAGGAATGTAQADALAGLLAGTGTASGASASTASTPAVQGTVTKVEATSITVTKADGTTVVITIDNRAEIARRAKAALTDVKIGDNVAAIGTTDSAGNVAAAQVTVGDLEAVAADATTDTTTTDTTPTPATASDLGGLLGG